MENTSKHLLSSVNSKLKTVLSLFSHQWQRSEDKFTSLVFLVFIFWPHHRACWILVPQPGMEPVPTEVEAWILNQWITRKVPIFLVFLALDCLTSQQTHTWSLWLGLGLCNTYCNGQATSQEIAWFWGATPSENNYSSEQDQCRPQLRISLCFLCRLTVIKTDLLNVFQVPGNSWLNYSSDSELRRNTSLQ